jgi:hypothetical protein
VSNTSEIHYHAVLFFVQRRSKFAETALSVAGPDLLPLAC